MALFKNTTWTKRNYDLTNVVYQVAPHGEPPRRFNGDVAPAGEWERVTDIPAGFDDIGGFSGYTFHGFL